MNIQRITCFFLVFSALLLGAACGSNANDDGADQDIPQQETPSDDVPEPGNNDPNNLPSDAPDTELDLATGNVRNPITFFMLPPVPSSCDAPGARQRVPFVFQSQGGLPIVLGDQVNRELVLPNLTLGSGSIAAQRTRLAHLVPQECSSHDDCSEDAKCASAGLAGATRQCTVQTGMQWVGQSARQDFDTGLTSQKQLVTVLVENTAGFEGRLPTSVGSLYGEDGEKDLLANPARATDPQAVHKASIKEFLLNLASIANPANTSVSLWWFSGDVGTHTRPLTGEGTEDFFTNNLSVLTEVFDDMPSYVPRTANLWQSIHRVIDRDLGLTKYEDHEKFLFVFTANPNEVHDTRATSQSVLDALLKHNIHLFIVHLDAEVEPPALRDLPSYWEDSQSCQSAADCEHFERCRVANIYPEQAEQPVSQSTEKYCLPDRERLGGRLGPLDTYADLACRSGGNYIYVSQAEQMRTYWRVLPAVIDGQWSIEADFSALGTHGTMKPGFYQASGVFVGALGDTDLSSTWSAPVEGRPGHDTRPVMRMGRASH